MDAIVALEQEHRVIEEALAALERWAEAVVHSHADDRDELQRFVSFIRGFADACHHGKEEKILFARAAEKGLPPNEGPIAVMLAEHQEARFLTQVLDGLARHPTPWQESHRRQLSETTRAYVSLLRRHIQKEEAILYPLIAARLSSEARAEIATAFERFEAVETGIGEHERLHELAESLITAHAPHAHAHEPPRAQHHR